MTILLYVVLGLLAYFLLGFAAFRARVYVTKGVRRFYHNSLGSYYSHGERRKKSNNFCDSMKPRYYTPRDGVNYILGGVFVFIGMSVWGLFYGIGYAWKSLFNGDFSTHPGVNKFFGLK